MKSNFLNLDWKDIAKGCILAIIMAIVTGVYQAIQAGMLEFTWTFWQPILYTGLGAGLAYILKNVLTNSEDKFLKPESK